ncbi:hypothetical protein BLOT_000600 [Blomia tropicalis]|nr:hypothetical protein BLOT_000600 [Blomia tropicalis]
MNNNTTNVENSPSIRRTNSYRVALCKSVLRKTNKPTFKRNFRGSSRLKSIQNDETVAGEEEQQNIKTIEIEETNLDDSDALTNFMPQFIQELQQLNK